MVGIDLQNDMPLPSHSPTPIIAPQSEGFSPKQFQAKIIQGVCEALASQPRAPCLLRSPTGSGKTFVLTKILESVSKTSNVLWLWFVPYVNLVAQTVDTLDSLATETGLIAKHLGDAQNEAPAPSHIKRATPTRLTMTAAAWPPFLNWREGAGWRLAWWWTRPTSLCTVPPNLVIL